MGTRQFQGACIFTDVNYMLCHQLHSQLGLLARPIPLPSQSRPSERASRATQGPKSRHISPRIHKTERGHGNIFIRRSDEIGTQNGERTWGYIIRSGDNGRVRQWALESSRVHALSVKHTKCCVLYRARTVVPWDVGEHPFSHREVQQHSTVQ